MSLVVQELGTGRDDDVAWDEWVRPRTTTVTDLAGWRHVVREAYGIESVALVATDGTRWRGVLVVHDVRHPVFGHAMVTAPFGTDGGLIAEDDAARTLLAERATAIARERGASYLLIRTRDGGVPGFVDDTRYVTAIKSIDTDEDALWHEGFGFKTRNHIRRGQKGGFELSWGHERIDEFHAVFVRHMRDLGSPAHGRAFYRAILRHLPDETRVLVARHGDRTAAGALVFHVNGTAANLHTVALRDYNRQRVNYLVYWEMLRRAVRAGCRSFDMGRTLEPSGNLDFKRNWRPEIVRLHYNYALLDRDEPPNLDPRNPRYRLAIAVWRRLPVPIAARLGPRVIAGLP